MLPPLMSGIPDQMLPACADTACSAKSASNDAAHDPIFRSSTVDHAHLRPSFDAVSRDRLNTIWRRKICHRTFQPTDKTAPYLLEYKHGPIEDHAKRRPFGLLIARQGCVGIMVCVHVGLGNRGAIQAILKISAVKHVSDRSS